MPRQSRIVIPEIPHHITQRSNYQQTIFERDKDFRKYCRWLEEYSRKYHFEVLAYCLMSNHIHCIGVPGEQETLARVFNTLHMRYAQYVNYKRGAKGHVWQGRFYSCLLGDTHLYRAIRYVENNPVRAKMVKYAWEYDWSSAQGHVGLKADATLSKGKPFKMDGEQWREYLQEEDREITEEIRVKTQKGLAVGLNSFIDQLESKLNRSLACVNPGRPRKRE